MGIRDGAWAIKRNTAGLIAFLKGGMADGSVRPCDSEVVAQCVLGMLAWAQMTPQWVSGDNSQKYRKRLLSAVLEIIDRGIAIERGPLVCNLDADSFLPGPVNVFDRRAATALKVEQLLRTASGLFNRHGIEATSLDHIVAELGASKACIIHTPCPAHKLTRRKSGGHRYRVKLFLKHLTTKYSILI